MNRHTPTDHRSERRRVEEELGVDIEKWRALLDDAKLELYLGPREIRDRLDPELKTVDQELQRAKEQLRLLEESPESEWPSIRGSLHHTLGGVRKYFHWLQSGIEAPDEP